MADVAVRKTPNVIQVPPAKAGPGYIGWALLITVAGVPLVALGVPAGRAAEWGIVAIALGLIPWICFLRVRRFNRARRDWLAHHADWDSDPIAARIDSGWYILSRPPELKSLRHTVRSADIGHDQAVVLAMGAFELPEAGNYRFEPELLAPGEFMNRSQYAALAAVFAIAALLALGLYLLELVPSGSRVTPIAVGVVAALLATAAWRFAIRPTYVRLAPGMVDVIAFGLLRSQPRIRAYPVSPGTLFAVIQQFNTTVLVLATNDHHDTIEIGARRRDPFLERFWQAVLSTAPTPPLSNVELLG